MAFALVSNIKGQANDTFSTSAIDTSGANLLVMVVHSDHATITPSDSKTNTWLQAVQEATFKIGTIYYAWSATVGTAHTFTLTGTDHFGTIQVYAFSGAQTSGDPLDQTNHGINFGGTTVQPGSVTPTSDGQLIVTGDNHDTANVETINSAFTSPAGAGTGYGDVQSLGVALGGHSAYLIQGTAAAVNPTWTNVSGSNHYCTIATFKAGAGGGGGGGGIVTAASSLRHRPDTRPGLFRPGIAR